VSNVHVHACDVSIVDTRTRHLAESAPGCWLVDVTLFVRPKPIAGVGYVAGDDGRVQLTFTAYVDAANEAEAVYKVAMAAFEHELLECMLVDGKPWCDPHENATPTGVRVLRQR
jgi:hypothetical protein